MKNKLKISVVEIVLYSVFGLIALWGLVYLCLGFACNFVSYKSGLYQTNQELLTTGTKLGFLTQGVIIVAVGVAALVVTLLVTSKKSDREFEKTQRRAARLSQRNNVVDAEVKE